MMPSYLVEQGLNLDHSFLTILAVNSISSPGNVSVSLTQSPGRGSGTRLLSTGSQAELLVACSLNFPLKAS